MTPAELHPNDGRCPGCNGDRELQGDSYCPECDYLLSLHTDPFSCPTEAEARAAFGDR